MRLRLRRMDQLKKLTLKIKNTKMKKTLIINIGNSIIHIEEDAYEILTSYLNEIKQHFAKTADNFEIVTDIENRIAEMFAEILEATKKQVVEITDVEGVIAQMGRVQDFQTEEEQGDDQPHYSSFSGGKKLYRDTDEGVFAGVCAGLGHYLNIEARWIRLATLLSIFLGGAGILAYLILWIAIPRAISRSERMEMKGEATNLYGYKRSFEEELAAFKENMNRANEHFKPFVKHSSNFFGELGAVLGNIIKLIGKIIAATFIVIGFGFLVTLLIALAVSLGFWESNAFEHFPFSVVNEDFRVEIILAAFVVLFIPVLALVLFALRVAFNKLAISRTLSLALLVIWLFGVGSSFYYVAKITSEFKEHAELIKTDELKSYPTYVVEVDKTMAFSKRDSLKYNITDLGDGFVVNDDDDNDHPFREPRSIRIEIEKSENGKTAMVQTYEAQGKTFKVALENVKNINYKFSQRDSLITLSPRLSLKRESIWRAQEVYLSLKVPVGTHLLLNDNIYSHLQFYNYYCNTDENNTNKYREWVMTADGLKCKSELDGQKAENP
jgi:phage shock protein PspC (stress-responsive transcriptional regulator)